jgi:2-aminoadipate transaminase
VNKKESPAARADTLERVPETPISFARGAPALELIPAAELAECARASAEKEGPSVFAYGPGGGYGPLRAWVADRHGVEAGRVVLTMGGLLGFVLYAGELLARRPGRVLVEGPTYDRPLKILGREGVEVVVLPTDEEGLDPDALEAELSRTREQPSFLYTIPTFQNPSGRTLPEERRRRIVEIAAVRDLAILEDDPYGLVRYQGEAPPTLHELEGGERVTYTSSFSKTVAPGLRVGYFVLPPDAALAFEQRAVSTYISPPFLAQATLFEFLVRDRFESNLAHVKAGLRARRDAMLEALDEASPAATWNRPEGGYFVWVELVDGGDASDVLGRAEAAGVTFIAGADFYPRDSGRGEGALRLAFSYEPADRIADGISRLAGVLGTG